MRSSLVAGALACALVAPSIVAQTPVHIPDNNPVPNNANVIPFGSANYTYVGRVPASYLLPSEAAVEELSFFPTFTGTWNAPNVLIAIGHLPAVHPCPFTFPGPGAATIGSFLDLTVAYDSAVNGPLAWPCVADTWCPMGFTALGGTGFVWNGVDDIGVYVTFGGASGGGSCRRSSAPAPTRTYSAAYQAASSGTCNSTAGLYMRLTCVPAGPLSANFTLSGATGPAPRTVTFTDTSFSSDPAGIQVWAWDFDGDNNFDSTAQNPTHTYLVPGTYTVSLTVSDTLNPTSTKTVVGAVQVGQYELDVFTTGGGVGDLVVTAVPTIGHPGTVQGYTFLTFAPTGAVGSGPAFGLTPDLNFWNILFLAPSVGNPLSHFPAPGFYPDVPFALPAGSVSFLAGVTADFVQVGLSATYALSLVSNVDRVTF
jgi:PKD repeat protein